MGFFDHPLVERLAYFVVRGLRDELDDIVREYEAKHEPPTEAELAKMVADLSPADHLPETPSELHAAGIIPLKVSDLDREIEEMRTQFDELHGWLLFRFYNDGSHSYVTFGCWHPEQLTLAGAVLTHEALIESRHAVEPDNDLVRR
jgi:hypothetical protein